MTQLILNNSIYLPQTSWNKYRCYPAQLSHQVDMISGRRVLEVRGSVQMIEYEYDYMGNDLMRQVNAVLRSGKSFPATYLPDSGDTMQAGIFITDTFPVPEFAFSKGGVALWHNVSFVLREVSPHD